MANLNKLFTVLIKFDSKRYNTIYLDGVKVPVKNELCELKLKKGTHQIALPLSKSKGTYIAILSALAELGSDLVTSGSASGFQRLFENIYEPFILFDIEVLSDQYFVYENQELISEQGKLQNIRISKISICNKKKALVLLIAYTFPLVLLMFTLISVLVVFSIRLFNNEWYKEAFLLFTCALIVFFIMIHYFKRNKKLKKVVDELKNKG